MAEHIKLSAAVDDEIEFEDIMSLKHTIKAEEVWELTEPLVDKMTTDVAEKIKELNGDQSVSATFIVGGGGKIHGFDEMLAKKLELPQERVALRGEEVLKEVKFLQEDIVKDPLLVTPIGICLNYYEQKNNFIMVRFNGERLKLYDNNKLTIVDAAIQAGFPNDQLFPKRGREINFTVNGRPRIVRGDAGEAAIIRMNDRPASINTPIEPNCEITIEPSTAGREAHYVVGQLEEYRSSTITFEVNGKLITCPRYVEVNGILEPPTYEIKENDAIVTRSFYTVGQLAEFMDVELDMDADILVNNRVEDLQALVYENFSVDWKVISYRSTPQDVYPDAPPKKLPQRVDAQPQNLPQKVDVQSQNLPQKVDVQVQGLPQKVDVQSQNLPQKVDVQAQGLPQKMDVQAQGLPQKVDVQTQNLPQKSDMQMQSLSQNLPQPEDIQMQNLSQNGDMQVQSMPQPFGQIPESQPEQAAETADAAKLREATENAEVLLDVVKETLANASGAAAKPTDGVVYTGPASAASTMQTAPVQAEEEETKQMEQAVADTYAKEADHPQEPSCRIIVNGEEITMKNKKEFIFVDIFDYILFDLSQSRGRMLITQVNGEAAQYTQKLYPGDKIDIYWKEN